jgi:hypothetical protein
MYASRKMPLEIHFIYLCKKEFYCILRCAVESLLYFTKNAIYFIILSFSVQIILVFFINHVLEFKYPPQSIKDYG